MKRTFTSIKTLPGVFRLGLCVFFCSCAFTENGNRINGEQRALADLEEKRHGLESRYVIVLNGLEEHPTDRRLMGERDRTRDQIRELTFQINEKRKALDQSLADWDEKIVQDRVQQQMIDKSVKENRNADEEATGTEFETK